MHIKVKVLKDYKIDSLITQEEFENIIHHMVETYDNHQYYYKPFDEANEAKLLFETYSKRYKEIYNVLENRAIEDEIKEEEEKKEEREDNLLTWFDDELSLSESETPRWERIDNMFCCILKQIEPIAEEIRNDRINHRIKERTVIDVNTYKHSEFQDFIEFFHDGGWGVTNKKGVVLISNRLICKASMCSPIFSENSFHSDHINNQLYKSTDRDTDLHGVISRTPLKRVLKCKFKEIQSIESFWNGDYYFAFNVLARNDKWGCYNEYGKRIAKCKYDTIDFNAGYIECGKGYFHLQNNEDGNGWTHVFDGIKDLYDTDGHLILGGYTELKFYEQNNFYLFYFGTYKEPIPYHVDNWKLEKYVTCYDDAKCLVLDQNFKPIITDGSTSFKGKIFEDIESVASSCLISGEIKEIHDNFIISKEIKLEPIDSEKDMEVNKDYCEMENTHLYKESNITSVTFINKRGHVEWKTVVDDYIRWSYPILVQIENKIGFINNRGVQLSSFDAISEYTYNKGERYAAKITVLKDDDLSIYNNNPNYIPLKKVIIQYYRIIFKNKPQKIEDNWDIFNPNDISWFPNNFLTKMGIYDDEYDDYDESHYEESGYEWTDEDAWDAMTDGMYGDYPGTGWDPELLGFYNEIIS